MAEESKHSKEWVVYVVYITRVARNSPYHQACTDFGFQSMSMAEKIQLDSRVSDMLYVGEHEYLTQIGL
jgi:hypothetical protein